MKVDTENVVGYHEETGEPMFECPACKIADVMHGDDRCNNPMCAVALEFDDEPYEIECPHCGKYVMSDSEYCPTWYCGKAIAE